jgi:hypothetical protein
MQQPAIAPQAIPSATPIPTCPLCDSRAGAFVVDHRNLPRHQLRYGYACDCAGRFTVPAEEDFFLRQRDTAHRQVVAQVMRQRSGIIHLDAVTFRRLLLETATA